MDAMVEVKGLGKTFMRKDSTPIHAVKGVSLSIHKGEIFSLLGPNGAGKTTTISMISGLIEPSEGDAFIGGYSIRQQPRQAKELIGVVPQEIALYPELTARQNLWFFGRMYSLRGKELKMRMDEVIEFMDLEERQHDRIDTFSGGMKRRVNIGVGLLNRPQLVYMDEPTAGVDPQNRRRILDTVFRLRDEYQMTVLYTTHLMEEAEELSDRIGIIDYGEIIALGTQAELTEQIGAEDRLVIEVKRPSDEQSLLDALRAHPQASKVEYQVDNLKDADRRVGNTIAPAEEAVLTVYCQNGRKLLAEVLNIIGQQVEISSIEVRQPDLEAVFLNLTGRALRD